MKRFFLFLLILGLFVSIPVFADDYTLQDLGLYDSSVNLPSFPVPPDDYPYYMVYYDCRNSQKPIWIVNYFDRVDGINLMSVDFESSENDYFYLMGNSAISYMYKAYALVDGDWEFEQDGIQTGVQLQYRVKGYALNYTNFDIVGGDHTVLANPMVGGVPLILRSTLPFLLQTIMQVGSAVLPRALLILGILLVIGLIPRLIRSWAH